MKKFSWIVFIAVLLLAGCGTDEGYVTVDITEVQQLQDDGAIVLDVREVEEFT